MSTEANNQEASVQAESNEGEQKPVDKFEISKAEYDELIKDRASLGSMKREFKDLKKALEARDEAKETPQKSAPDTTLMEKAYLAARNITEDDEVDEALAIAKKLGVSVDQAFKDDYFQTRMEKFRTTKANALATESVKGGNGEASAKLKPEYWIAKGTPPTPSDIPNRKDRVAIHKAMMAAGKDGKKFWNE